MPVTPKKCPIILESGLSCGRPATVLDHHRTTGYPAVYICQQCFEREYPELQPTKPTLPPEPIYGGQYAARDVAGTL